MARDMKMAEGSQALVQEPEAGWVTGVPVPNQELSSITRGQLTDESTWDVPCLCRPHFCRIVSVAWGLLFQRTPVQSPASGDLRLSFH